MILVLCQTNADILGTKNNKSSIDSPRTWPCAKQPEKARVPPPNSESNECQLGEIISGSTINPSVWPRQHWLCSLISCINDSLPMETETNIHRPQNLSHDKQNYFNPHIVLNHTMCLQQNSVVFNITQRIKFQDFSVCSMMNNSWAASLCFIALGHLQVKYFRFQPWDN